MKRRTLIGTAVTATGGATVSISTPTVAQRNFEWKMLSAWPRGFPGLGEAAQRFAHRVSEATNGLFTIQVFGSDEVPVREQLEAVRHGTVEVMHATPRLWQSEIPGLLFFGGVPLGMTPSELASWIRFGGGQELWDELYNTFGLKPFHAGSTGYPMGAWFNQQIRSVDDIAGLRVRVSNALSAAIMSRLGAEIVSLPGNEIAPALERGVIDGAEFIGPYHDTLVGLPDVARFYHWPSLHEAPTELEITVNSEAWESLPDEMKAAFRCAAQSESAMTQSHLLHLNSVALSTLEEEYGVELTRFPFDLLRRAAQEIKNALHEFVEQDGSATEIYESYKRDLRRKQDLTEKTKLPTLNLRDAEPLPVDRG